MPTQHGQSPYVWLISFNEGIENELMSVDQQAILGNMIVSKVQ